MPKETDSPVSRGTPTEEELRALFTSGEKIARIAEGRHAISEDELLASGLNVAEQADIRNLRVAYAREVECWRWLSEHVSGLLDDSERLDWLDSRQTVDARWPVAQSMYWSARMSGPLREYIDDYRRRALDSTPSTPEQPAVSVPPEP